MLCKEVFEKFGNIVTNNTIWDIKKVVTQFYCTRNVVTFNT